MTTQIEKIKNTLEVLGWKSKSENVMIKNGLEVHWTKAVILSLKKLKAIEVAVKHIQDLTPEDFRG